MKTVLINYRDVYCFPQSAGDFHVLIDTLHLSLHDFKIPLLFAHNDKQYRRCTFTVFATFSVEIQPKTPRNWKKI